MPLELTSFHERLDEEEAALCRTIGLPLRLRILHHIAEHPDTPAGLAARLGVDERRVEVALSQLETARLVEPASPRKEGHRLRDPALGEALRILRQVAYRDLSHRRRAV